MIIGASNQEKCVSFKKEELNMPEFVKTKVFVGVASFLGGVIVGKWIYEPSGEVEAVEGGKKKKKKKDKAD